MFEFWSDPNIQTFQDNDFRSKYIIKTSYFGTKYFSRAKRYTWQAYQDLIFILITMCSGCLVSGFDLSLEISWNLARDLFPYIHSLNHGLSLFTGRIWRLEWNWWHSLKFKEKNIKFTLRISRLSLVCCIPYFPNLLISKLKY